MTFSVAYCGTIQIYPILINFIIAYFLPLLCCGLILVYVERITGIVSAAIFSWYLRLKCGHDFKIPRLRFKVFSGGLRFQTTGVTTVKIQPPNEKLPFSLTVELQDIKINVPIFWFSTLLFQGCEVEANGVTILLEKKEQNHLDSIQECTDTVKEFLCPYDEDYRNGSDNKVLIFIKNILLAAEFHVVDIKVILLSHMGTSSVATELCLKSADTIRDSVLKHFIVKGLSVNTWHIERPICFQQAEEDCRLTDICSLLQDTEETAVLVGKVVQNQEVHIWLQYREPEFKETDGSSQISYLDMILSFFFIGKVDVRAKDNKPVPKLEWNVSCDPLLFFLPPQLLCSLLQCVGSLMGIRYPTCTTSSNCSPSMLHMFSVAFGNICVVVPHDDDLQNISNSEVPPRSLTMSFKRSAEKVFEAFMLSGVDFTSVAEMRKAPSSLYPGDHFSFVVSQLKLENEVSSTETGFYLTHSGVEFIDCLHISKNPAILEDHCKEDCKMPDVNSVQKDTTINSVMVAELVTKEKICLKEEGLVNFGTLFSFIPPQHIHFLSELADCLIRNVSFSQDSSPIQFHSTFDSICVVIPYDELLNTSNNKSQSMSVRATPSASMRAERCKALISGAVDLKNLANIRKELSSLGHQNHFRLMVSDFIVEKNVISPMEANVSSTSANIEIVDCWYTSEDATKFKDCCREVSIFKQHQRQTKSESAEQNNLCVKINYQFAQCSSPSLNVHIPNFASEIDMYVIGHVHHVLPLFYKPKKSKNNQWRTGNEQTLRLNVNCPFAYITFRFPEPEICANALILELSRASFTTILDGNDWEEIEVQYNNFQGFLLEFPESDPVPFIQVSLYPNIDQMAKDNGVDWPRIVISNQCHKCLLEEQSYNIPDLLSNSKSSLFSNSSFCGSTSLPDEENDGCETEIIMPSCKENMCDFIDETVNKSWYVVKLDLQNCTLFLKDKHLLELFYSSFKAVMQWKIEAAIPTADSDLENSEQLSVHVPLPDMGCHASKGQRYLETLEDYINDSSDDENEDSLRQKLNQEEDRTDLSVIVNVQRGAIVMHSPLRNGSKKLSPETGGRMVFQVEDCKVFTAPSYNGNPNESYLCVLSNKGSLHHSGYMSLPNDPFDFEALTNIDDLQPVIYNSETGILAHTGLSFRTGKDGLDILSVSVHATHDVQEKIKNFKIAAQLQAATLRYCPTSLSEAWQTQLMSLLSDIDSSANQCATSSVIDLNLHFECCTVDYRPRHLPLHVIITIKCLDLPKMAISAYTLPPRVIVEEICLYLSNKTADFLNLKNYVCVLQTGLFEMSVSTTNEGDVLRPVIKLLASNDIVYIRTCLDSCQALLTLIKYTACNGDFASETCYPDDQVSCLDREPVLQNVSSDVEKLIEDAMMECPDISDSQSQSGTKHDYTEINLGIAEEFFDSIDDIDSELKRFPTRDILKALENFPVLFHYLIQSSIVWKIYDGDDFPASEENDSLNSSYCSSRFPDEMLQGIRDSSTTIGDGELFFITENESFISVGNESVSCSWKERGGKNRNHNCAVEFHLTKVQVQREVYREGPYASRDVLTLRNVEILDGLVTSDINKFLYSHESNEHTLVVQAIYSRPYAGQHSEECALEVSAESLQFNIDQDTLIFMLSFFKKAFGSSAGKNPPESPEYRHCERPIHTTSESSMNPTFFKSFTFTEEMVIRLDYTGKRIAFNPGVLSGVMMGLAELSGSQIKLKRLSYNKGLLGYRKLAHYVLSCWAKDIRQNQISGLLCGIGPMDPVIRLVTGIKDLVWLPVEEVCNEGHLVTGLKRGAASFWSKSPAAALELTSKAIRITEDAAILACETITPGPSRGGQRKRNHPSDIRDGMSEAWKTVRHGVCNSAKTVANFVVQEHKHKGLHAAFGSLVREFPTACVNTVISGAEASQIVLESARNHLSPKICREMKNKYKNNNKQGRSL